MKYFVSFILSFVVFLASFQSSLLFWDYQINRDFYEMHCVNKANPEMDCHGKCEMQKESEQTNSPLNIVKIGFEFNILPTRNIEIPKRSVSLSVEEKSIFSVHNKNLQEGYSKVLSPPPNA